MALLVVLGFSLGCSEFVVIGIEDDLARAYGVSLSQAGELVSLFAVTYAVLTPVLAIVTGRLRRYTLLAAYSAVFVAGNLVAALAPSFAWLLASRAVIGSVSGALLAVGVTYVPELVSERRQAMVISVVYASFAVAMVVITSLGHMVAAYLDWRLMTWGTLALAVVVCALLLLLLPRTGKTDEPSTVREQLALLAEPQVLCGIAIFVFGVGSVYVLYGYVAPYLEEVVGLDTVQTSAVLVAYGVACLASNLLSGVLATRVGLRAMLVTFPVLAALLLGIWLARGSAVVSVACLMGVALCMYLASIPCVQMFMASSRLRHPKALTLASSLEPMSFNIGIAFGTELGGLAVAGPGLASVGLIGAVLALVACALVAVTLRLARRAGVPT